MNQTAKGLVIFVSALLTIGFWMPLSNSPRLGPSGSTMTETYFGVLRYATVTATMKEPNFTLDWTVDARRLVSTIAITAGFWAVVLWFLLRHRRAVSVS